MRTYQLGRTGIELTCIGLGCWQFAGGRGIVSGYWESPDKGTTTEIVRIALDGGVNWFDTAEVYGKGASETALRDSLSELGVQPDDVHIATKWFPFLRGSSSVQKSFEERERHLSPYPVTLHQVHFPRRFGSLERQMHAFADLVDQGRIRAVGVSNFSAHQMERAATILDKRGIALAANQVRYNLIDRSAERNDTLMVARDIGATVIAYSPLAQGVLTGKFHDNPALVRHKRGPRRHLAAFKRPAMERTKPLIDVLKEIGRRRGATCAEVALSWTVSRHAGHMLVIPGATKPAQAEQNCRAAHLVLAAEEVERIDHVSLQIEGNR